MGRFGKLLLSCVECLVSLRGGGGGAGRETVLLIFQPSNFIVYIYYDQYEKIRREKIFTAVGFHGNGGRIRF